MYRILQNELSLAIIYFMRRLYSVLLIVPVLCVVFCKPCSAQLANGWKNPFDKDIWYKRYTGTIGGNPVVVNLALWDYFITGDYSFNEKSDLAELGVNKKEASTDGTLAIYGFAPDAKFADTAGSKSRVTFKGDKIKGMWESADHKKTAEIDLKESYPEGSYPFDLEITKDSILVNNNMSGLYSTFKMTVPGKKMKKQEGEWFEKALVQELAGEKTDVTSIDDYIKMSNIKEFASYKKLTDDSMGSPKNYFLTMVAEPWYNNHGIVVIKVDYYVAIPTVSTRESYYCFDMQHRKTLHLRDIMNLDTTKLEALLEPEMAEWYAPTRPGYNGPFASISNDIYVSDFGVTFLFGNNDFMNTPCFFVPYTKLKGMLKPEFKSQMKL